MAEETKRYAVVTGANKGIGFEICRQLALNGIVVILTARDVKRGTEAVQKLKEHCAVSDDLVFFHQLDVTDPDSINSLPEYIKTRFRKLDILVNNAGISGVQIDKEALKVSSIGKEGTQINWNAVMTQTYELAESCIQTNYYGAKRTTEALLPLLQLSNSPTIVNVSSRNGKLEKITNEWAKQVLSDVDNLTEDRIDEVLSAFLKDFMEGSLDAKGWRSFLAANTVSKAAMNAYTRVLAKRYPNFCVNCVCPGFVRTDINFNMGILSVEEGAASPVRLALLPNGGPSGRYFVRKEEKPF